MFPEKRGLCNVPQIRNTIRHGKRTVSKFVWIILVVFVVGMIPAAASANPPKSVTLSYDAAVKMLRVTILHPSFAPSWHYIKTVTVQKNKQPVMTYSYKSQPADEFTYSYEIPAEPGDTFVVNAYCSMYGSRTESLAVPATSAAPAEPRP